MKSKKILSLLLVSALCMGAVGCGSSEDSGNSGNDIASSDNKKITIWAWDESFNIKAANEAKEIYLKDNPDVDVEVVTMAQDDIVAKLNTNLASGSYEGLPDIVLIEDYKIQNYLTAYEDEFADLSSVASADDFAEFKTGVNVIDGKLYGIPFDSGVTGTFYRTDLIEQAGYTKEDMENLTWDKFIEIGKAVKEKTGASMCTIDPSDLGIIRMMLQSAGSWYTDKDGNVDIANNQALKDAIAVYQDLVAADIAKQTADWDQFVGAINNGDVATVPTGCWISASIKNGEDQSGKWAVAEFPRMEANSDSVNASSCGGAAWYVLKNVGNSDLAVDFLGKTFASDVDLMNQLAIDIGLVSTLNAASAGSNYSAGDDFYGGQATIGDLASWNADVPSVNYGLHTYAIEDIMTEAMQEILNGADVNSTLEKYQTQIEAAVAQ